MTIGSSTIDYVRGWRKENEVGQEMSCTYIFLAFSSSNFCSTEATSLFVFTTVSGFTLTESMPAFTRNSVNSGYTDGPCPHMETVLPISWASLMSIAIARVTAGVRSSK